ncbi:MAG: hypothetical protein PWQ41_1734 [Bacillota bacterium]|jgi:hypothetical protein|nr:hypothetical protein [Bacillota bacterium]MDK2925960.1 hypothetical protein [Bacillota bacterium]
MDWGQVSAIFSAMAAAGAFVTARVTYVQADRQRKVDIMPLLVLSCGKGIQKSRYCLLDPEAPLSESRRLDFERYPAYLYFTNLGKGLARLLVVDLDTKDIVCTIGTPVSIGPGRMAHVKLWLPQHNVNYSVKLALYYWSIEGQCFWSASGTNGPMMKFQARKSAQNSSGMWLQKKLYPSRVSKNLSALCSGPEIPFFIDFLYKIHAVQQVVDRILCMVVANIRNDK